MKSSLLRLKYFPCYIYNREVSSERMREKSMTSSVFLNKPITVRPKFYYPLPGANFRTNTRSECYLTSRDAHSNNDIFIKKVKLFSSTVTTPMLQRIDKPYYTV